MLLNKATTLDPRFVIAFLEKGLALGRLGKDQDAIIAYDRAITVDPSSTAAYFHKGLSLKNLNRFEDARLAFEAAINLDTGKIRDLV